MNQAILTVAERLSREYFRLGENYVLDSYSVNRKEAKLVFTNDALIHITVKMPFFLVEATALEEGEI